ncbi:methyltransferase domain-containing protein [Brevibacterium sp. 50QC2O2]|uniref:methyltransferase domain-containing protein n=1 Tax=Brevibacterium TaxID=1696 RepID=UPI00211BBE36|nr:methyltransferase domain-containing protein [Brevibacterium sp. 68QC2CO]MCQ9389459.1 methyltransferase domain-containing protein [Brevibacterium sp. 50QC2O2]
MRCAHYEAGTCRSCTLLPVPFGTRVDRAQADLEELLAPFTRDAAARIWRAPITGPEAGFRNKAKMVVTGTADAPVFGIVDPAGNGVDLRDCPLYPPVIMKVLDLLPALIKRAQVSPYSIARRRGELKYVLITAGDVPAGAGDPAVLVRFVLRTEKPVERLREHLHLLVESLAPGSVVTANIQPEPKAIIEGPTEVHLAGPDTLSVTQGRIRLLLRPQSFLQTNTTVASGLYRQVSNWVDEIDPGEVWDLFCGVGGFALHCAQPAEPRPAGTAPGADPGARTLEPGAIVLEPRRRRVTGVEISPAAIESAKQSAAEYGLDADFYAGDAAAWFRERTAAGRRPDALIVNPPRRGVGREMAAWIQDSGIPDVVYSSCNPATLARDLEAMSAYRITAARLLDMFPHTRHAEVLVRLSR